MTPSDPNARAAYDSFLTGLSKIDPSQRSTFNQAASYVGNTFGKFISPQEYLPTLQSIYNTPSSGGASQGASSSLLSGSGSGVPTTDYNSLIQSGRQNLNSSVGTAIQGGGQQLQGSILDYLDSLKHQQGNINLEAQQNELAKIQGTQGVNAAVGRGIRSGGTLLANKNAGSSSAVQGIADAYGQLGRQQLSQVGSQYAQGQAKIGQEQGLLNDANTAQIRHTQEDKTNIINGILNSAQTQLAQLDQLAIQGSLPDRINIEQEKAQIKQQALNQLAQYDQMLSSGIAGIGPASLQDNQAAARNMSLQGQAPASAFNFTSNTPAQFQGTGPSASSLPLFTLNKRQLA